jgi:hypothetical protein
MSIQRDNPSVPLYTICQLDVFAPMGYSTIDLSEDSLDFPFSHRTEGSYLFLLS